MTNEELYNKSNVLWHLTQESTDQLSELLMHSRVRLKKTEVYGYITHIIYGQRSTDGSIGDILVVMEDAEWGGKHRHPISEFEFIEESHDDEDDW